MTITWGKLLALLVGVSFLAFCAIQGVEASMGLRLLVCLVVAQFLIWFPDALGSYTGFTGFSHSHAIRPKIDVSSPGCVISLVGWLMLLGGIPTYYWLLTRTE